MRAELETRRLRLRGMSRSDGDALLSIFSDPVAMRYYPGTRTREQTSGWIEWNLQMVGERGHGMWIAELAGSGDFVGTVGLVVQDVAGREEVELGYLLQRRHWGRGLATEAACACRDHGFQVLERPRLVSLIDPANAASRGVAERVGMSLEGEIDKWHKRVCVYAIARPGT